MDLKNITTFVHITQSHSFTKTAEVLGYSQSSVSAQIKQLETELGIRLFDRINHTVALTTAGEEFLETALKIDNLLRNVGNDAQTGRELHGNIRINMGESFEIIALGARFEEFRELYPNITLRITESKMQDFYIGLDQNKADFVVYIGERIFSEDYVIAYEENVEMSFVTGKGSPYDKPGELTVSEIAKYPFILTEKDMGYRAIMDKALADRSIIISPILEIGNTSLICSLLARGNGVSYLPKYITKDGIKNGNLVQLTVTDFDVTVWHQILHHKNKWLSPEIRKCIEFFSKPLSEY